MVNIGIGTMIIHSSSCPYIGIFDSGPPRSNLRHLKFVVDHGQTKVISLLYHVKLRWVTMIIHGKTMVDYGLTVVGVEALIEVDVIIIVLLCPCIKQVLSSSLRVQASIMHSCVSFLGPSQSRPPFNGAGLIQDR